LDRALIRFIAMEMVEWASGDRAPSDIAELTNRWRMDATGSTCSSGLGTTRGK
jgi:hypothetical protein